MAEMLTEREILAKLKICRRTFFSWCVSGKFPAPIRLPDGRSKRWLVEDVKAWEDQLREQRQTPPEVSA